MGKENRDHCYLQISHYNVAFIYHLCGKHIYQSSILRVRFLYPCWQFPLNDNLQIKIFDWKGTALKGGRLSIRKLNKSDVESGGMYNGVQLIGTNQGPLSESGYGNFL